MGFSYVKSIFIIFFFQLQVVQLSIYVRTAPDHELSVGILFLSVVVLFTVPQSLKSDTLQLLSEERTSQWSRSNRRPGQAIKLGSTQAVRKLIFPHSFFLDVSQ